jgi:hypothetical protein
MEGEQTDEAAADVVELDASVVLHVVAYDHQQWHGCKHTRTVVGGV